MNRGPWPGGGPEAVERACTVLADLTAGVRTNVALGPLTTYRVGGAAAVLAVVDTEPELTLVSVAARSSELPVLVVGRGSNLLVADAGFPGIAVVLGPAFASISISDSVECPRLLAGGAASMPVVARRSAAAGLTGFEWAAGVPGSIGGGVRMNAGGHGADMAACVVAARVFDLAAGAARDWNPHQLAFGYRRSAVHAHHVVVRAELELAPGDIGTAQARIDDIVRWRREHQPGGQNAGSVFANPPGDAAGRLVETAGAKAMRRGSAVVSTKHANFLQADEGGSADDVRALMEAVRDRVFAVHGVRLETEIRLIGFPGTYPHEDVEAEV